MKLTSKPLGILVLVILFAGILFSSAVGAWNTSSTKQPATFKDGEFAGQANPADIRGSYTFGDIQKAFDIPITDLKNAFEIPSNIDPSTYQVKNLETQFAALAAQGKEIGTTSVRYFVALYKGLPFSVTDDIYLPSVAVDILKQKANLTPEQLTYLEAHRVMTSMTEAQPPSPTLPSSNPIQLTPGSSKTEVVETDKIIKGKTTFSDVQNWGVSKSVIEEIIGGPIPAPGMTIKDFCSQKSLDFETVKNKLQEEINKTK